MVKSLPQPPTQIRRASRYSLRTLFFVSVVIAVPFLLMANLRHSLRPEESVASPLYLLLGIAGVVLAAAAGSAMGSRAGMFAAACIAAFCWIGLVLICGWFSKELSAVLPAHVIFAGATIVILAVVGWSARESKEEGPHATLLQLLRVKHDVQARQQGKDQNSAPADSSIPNPKSKIQN